MHHTANTCPSKNFVSAKVTGVKEKVNEKKNRREIK